MRRTLRSAFVVSFLTLSSVPISCSSSDSGGGGGGGTGGSGTDGGRTPDQAGQSCRTAADCYPRLRDGGAIQGTVTCMDRVPGGYCTHECQTDADCCAVPGECLTDLPQVCAPFESTGKMYCFLSCEDADIRAHETELFTDGAPLDANVFCEKRVGPSFSCRSTGGGAKNRMICSP